MSSEAGGSPIGWRRRSKLILVGSLAAFVAVMAGLYCFVSSPDGSILTPACVLLPQSDSDHSYRILNVTHECSWSDVEIRLVNVTNPGMHWVWYPSYDSLYSQIGSAVTEEYLAVGSWDELSTSPLCKITDIQGDGEMGTGDLFTLNLTECTLGSTCSYELILLYPDTGNPIATCQFSA